MCTRQWRLMGEYVVPWQWYYRPFKNNSVTLPTGVESAAAAGIWGVAYILGV